MEATPGAPQSSAQDYRDPISTATEAPSGARTNPQNASALATSRGGAGERNAEAEIGEPSELAGGGVYSPPALQRQVSEAIGPSTDDDDVGPSAPAVSDSNGNVVQFTLLLASTGTRHPFQLNERYLTKRNVMAKNEQGVFDPASISVYTLKELILKDWRDDWDQKPTSPSAIRLIFFGQLLADNATLRDSKISAEVSTNILHITVKPQDMAEDDDAGKGTKTSLRRGRSDSEATPGCRCVIL